MSIMMIVSAITRFQVGNVTMAPHMSIDACEPSHIESVGVSTITEKFDHYV